jgi:hypothetical protein
MGGTLDQSEACCAAVEARQFHGRAAWSPLVRYRQNGNFETPPYINPLRHVLNSLSKIPKKGTASAAGLTTQNGRTHVPAVLHHALPLLTHLPQNAVHQFMDHH